MARRSVQGCRLFLGILIVLLLLFPFLQEMARPILLTAVVASVFVAGVIVVKPGRLRVRHAVTLAGLQITLTGVAVALPGGSLPYICTVSLTLATMAILICYCIVCVLAYVLKANCITRDQIYAGISVYLMLGFAFGCIYFLIETLAPGGFMANTARPHASRTPDLMYFSFVTLATLGYGDITPVARSSRALAELEALAGTLYMAVFMARLVSMAAGGPATAATSHNTDHEFSQPASEFTHRRKTRL
jgi:hypothetical protein